MKNNKKIFVVLAVLIIVIFLAIFFINNFFRDYGVGKGDNFKKQEALFIEETSFEERENIIKNYIATKFNVSADLVTVLIARESETHINGMFVISSQAEEDKTGYFFGVINKKIDIVWAEESLPDCSIIRDYNFSSEMAPTCL